MNRALMFSKASDEWSTPQDLFDSLDAEFGFDIDCAATAANHKCRRWFGSGGVERDALTVVWGDATTICWLNPPYSRVREFIAKAASETREHAVIVVALVPARTDTRWWHEHVWNAEHDWRDGVSVRFIKGRLKFGQMTAGAPFPSVIVIFRPGGRTR